MVHPACALVLGETGGPGRDALVKTVEEAGYTPVPVDSWLQALAVAGDGPPPALVVTPWRLGREMDGMRLHLRLAERVPGIATVILFRPEDVDSMEDSPAPPGVRIVRNDPVDPSQLVSAARDAVAEALAARG